MAEVAVLLDDDLADLYAVVLDNGTLAARGHPNIATIAADP